MENYNAKQLLERYNAGLCTEQEKAMVEGWYLSLPERNAGPEAPRLWELKSEIWQSLDLPAKSRHRFRYMAAAASLVLCLSAGLYFSAAHLHHPATRRFVRQDIPPGGNRATLTLADGKRIVLSSAHRGTIAQHAGVTVTAMPGGQLLFSVRAAAKFSDQYNSLVTPRGGQYQISLPDGSRIWLNAASSLKFPTVFSAAVRQVELQGEAYFEVAKNPDVPFRVITAKQQVEVLGTHFTVNCYPAEPSVRTALLEGAVKVSTADRQVSRMLRPGQQSLLEGDVIQVTPADLDEVLSWKNGLFIFNNEELESIMRKIARWYDVEVVYEDSSLGKAVFGGSVSRFGKVSEILRMLEITGNVRFSLKGRTIYVLKK